MSEPEAAWLAGLFDGEGCVVQPRKDRPTSLRITITNTYRPLLDRVVEVTGVGKIINHRPATDKHARCYYWACYSTNACELLKQMLPWLIVKRERATAAIARLGA